MPRLVGKTCLVTGAARGIGAAIVQAFVHEGAQVIVTDIDEEGGRAVAEEVGGDFHRLDVSSEEDWKALARNIPQLDVMVNNAGITGFEGPGAPPAHDPENCGLSAWHAVHAVNLDGTFLGCRYAIRAMRAKGAGSIINISSRSGMVGIPMAAAYASSKAAIRNHSKTVALYCAGQGLAIRCNSIHPAAVMTPMWGPMLGGGPDRAEREAAFVADTPLRRFGQPEEVAALAVMLASDEAAYMTGAELTIDGGILAGSAAAPG
ncbi:NAD(P)-dependent dehydrogenase, short-chain alcohol dehydrogenase family [Jannaschia faecimaris]|uniref:NAD(P)-dependent dehydrogenase, short-chain alcohol dehydrogenase family n=1 Tax=Jannaschia faecimaris TaxID=1244108 RepID=A0A1H3LT46_9RHOB|nr:SDR family oxidoreductase [Jannaschia faecimaris]SDY67543.1 NAD(P)-dependent dehydrogenase, short-chain alcohol dehydrogenase family [Jannaschia faecimaris]